MGRKTSFNDKNGYLKKFRESIKYWREARGLTQEKLGSLISINTSKQYINKLESGRNDYTPSLPFVCKLAEVLQIPPALLFDQDLPKQRAAQMSCAIKMFRNGCSMEDVQRENSLLSQEELDVLREELQSGRTDLWK